MWHSPKQISNVPKDKCGNWLRGWQSETLFEALSGRVVHSGGKAMLGISEWKMQWRTEKYPHSVQTWNVQRRQSCDRSVKRNLLSSYVPKHFETLVVSQENHNANELRTSSTVLPSGQLETYCYKWVKIDYYGQNIVVLYLLDIFAIVIDSDRDVKWSHLLWKAFKFVAK